MSEPVDFDEARARLAELARAHEQLELSPADVAARLQARARLLARPPEMPSAAASLSLVRFATDGVEWALADRWVRGLTRADRVAALPGAPPFVSGVTHQRGDLLLVVDLGTLVGIAAVAPGDDRLLLILGDERDELALLVANAVDTDAIGAAELLTPPHPMAEADSKLILGVTRDGCTVLDGAALLADPRLHFGASRR